MNRRSRVILLLLVGLLLMAGCDRVTDGSEFLMNAKDFLEVDEETFEKHLKEQFIVEDIVSGEYYLKGQAIFVTYVMADSRDLPTESGSASRLAYKHGITREAPSEKSVVAAIDLYLPYTVSKATAIKMLGYPSVFLGEHSETGLWRDKNSGHTLTVNHFEPVMRGMQMKMRIRVSVAAKVSDN